MDGQTTLPQKWDEEKEIGFCSRGKNGEVALTGDSGGPTVWKDKSDSNRAYIVGVISHGARDKEMCKLPPNQLHSKATIHATVSKEVKEWITKIVKKDADACLVHWKMETKESEVL